MKKIIFLAVFITIVYSGCSDKCNGGEGWCKNDNVYMICNELPAIHFDGLIIATVTFIIIGIFHPIVIKAEYYRGTKCWPIFAIFGTFTLAIAMFIENTIFSTLLSILSCTFFWSIIELFHQKKRVLKGWFPMNPKRKDAYKSKTDTP